MLFFLGWSLLLSQVVGGFSLVCDVGNEKSLGFSFSLCGSGGYILG